MQPKFVLLSSTMLAGFIAAAPALAADLYAMDPVPASAPAAVGDLPAVSGLNGKLSLYGGAFDGDDEEGGLYGAAGSVSVPLGHRFGMQADGFISSADEEAVGGVGAHLFWRNPEFALFGAYGSWATTDGADVFRAALETEIYLGRFALEGMIGWEGLDYEDFDDDDNLFGLADLAFYPTDDLRVSVGYRRFGDVDMAAVGAEYQLPVNWNGTGVALFAEGRIGEDDNRAALGGMRVYFGSSGKSLIRRHREDDPRERLTEEFSTFANSPSAAPAPAGCQGEIIEGECYPNNFPG